MEGTQEGIHMTIPVGNVQTEIYLKNSVFSKDHEFVFVVVAGNPGLVDFYVEFIDFLHEGLSGKFPIVGGVLI